MLTVPNALKLSRKKFVRKVRSDGRLKKYDSIIDERAWTLDKYERQHYIRDYIAAPYGSSQTGQNEDCDKLPLHMLIGALLSAKNQLLDNLQDQLDQLNNALSECKEDLGKCEDGTSRRKPSGEDSKKLYQTSKSHEESITIETEDGIFEGESLEYSAETTEIPANEEFGEGIPSETNLDNSPETDLDYNLETDLEYNPETAGIDERSSGGSRDEGDNYEHFPGETNIDDFHHTPGMPLGSLDCTDSEDSFECDDEESPSYGREGVRECEEDELNVYIKICDSDTDSKAREVYLGSLRLPRSSTVAAKKTVAPRSKNGYSTRSNGGSNYGRTEGDPSQLYAKYSRNRRSRSAGSRPSSPNDYQRQHAMIQKLNYYGNCKDYPSTENSLQSSSLEFLSQHDQGPPDMVDDDFQGSLNYPYSRNIDNSINYHSPHETINSQESYSVTKKKRPCNPSTRERRRISKKRYASKTTHGQHSHQPCPEKRRPKTSPYDSYSNTSPYIEHTTSRGQEEEFGIQNEYEEGMHDPKTAVARGPSQATQTDLTCTHVRGSGMMDGKDIESIQGLGKSSRIPSRNRVGSIGRRSNSLRSDRTTPSLPSEISINYTDEAESQRTNHSGYHSPIPCNKNGSTSQRTPQPKPDSSESRSNSLTNLQPHTSRSIRQSKPRIRSSVRESYSSAKRNDPSQMYDEEHPILRNREQRISRAEEPQMYPPRYSARNAHTLTNMQMQPPHKISQSYCISCQCGPPECTEQYSAQNPYYPPHFFQQNFTYSYPHF
ncbi:uncharacterized protein LOC124171646 isoform X2 [Ischnura elegans]|uniref:uncharacterized protein LOC124171646 isoform X2 n=1 Tax=Ischnura elegans TaxID=197161 RepID=UPI001ED887D8|nr:uncharacterized protein LOC124171646 isoform X2 [Ischnura elegans]